MAAYLASYLFLQRFSFHIMSLLYQNWFKVAFLCALLWIFWKPILFSKFLCVFVKFVFGLSIWKKLVNNPFKFLFCQVSFCSSNLFFVKFFLPSFFFVKILFVKFLFCQVFFKLSLPTVSCYLSRTLNSLNNTFIQLFPTFQILGTLVLTSSCAALLPLWPQDPNMLGIFLSYRVIFFTGTPP